MGIKLRLTILNFLQFFVFGTWLLSFGKYMFATLHFSGTEIGAVFMTLGIASLFMPAIMGIIADRWTGPNKIFALAHILGAGFLYMISQQSDFSGLYLYTLLYLMLYMPTIALDNTISYCIMEKNGMDIVKEFPPIRVWGTIGFIIAVWTTDLFGWGTNINQFYFAGASSIVLGIFTFFLPNCPVEKNAAKKTFVQAFGLDAFVLFKDKKMAIFFIY